MVKRFFVSLIVHFTMVRWVRKILLIQLIFFFLMDLSNPEDIQGLFKRRSDCFIFLNGKQLS